MKRTWKCDSCGFGETEVEYGDGVYGWSQIQGIKLDKTTNPTFCSACTDIMMNSIDIAFQEHRKLRIEK
jgi:hypothetical protein